MLPKLNTSQIDKLNIGLIVISLILAFILPFELFLFSYAVLGPLHYLTEVSWLHQKNYYIKQPKKYLWVFPILAALLTVLLITNEVGKSMGLKINPTIGQWGTNIIFFLFAISFALVILKKNWQKIAGLALIGVLTLSINFNSSCITCTNPQTNVTNSICNADAKTSTQFIQKNGADLNGDGFINLNGADNCTSQNRFRGMMLFFGAYIPTLIHVYFFTMFFMLFGALKSNSKFGYLAVIILILAGITPFIIDPQFLNYQIGETTRKIYDKTFLPLNQTIFESFRLGSTEVSSIYESNMGIRLTRFIAFAYTYHYLNWFSKTSIIQWHKVPVTNLVVVLVLWIVSIGLYAYNYIIGFTALLFLSFLHVFVEFPLNFQSFVGIAQSLRGKKIQSTQTAPG